MRGPLETEYTSTSKTTVALGGTGSTYAIGGRERQRVEIIKRDNTDKHDAVISEHMAIAVWLVRSRDTSHTEERRLETSLPRRVGGGLVKLVDDFSGRTGVALHAFIWLVLQIQTS